MLHAQYRVCHVQRNEDVVALSLTSDGCSRSIESKELVALPNLRFFRMKGIDILGNFENLLSELRWFSWEITHKEFYAKSFQFPNLVVLDLSRSNVEDDWGGWSQMQVQYILLCSPSFLVYRSFKHGTQVAFCLDLNFFVLV